MKNINLLMIVLVIYGLVMSGCSGKFIDSKPGTTYGKIYLGDPKVIERGRLVNDRLDQDLWLKNQLEESDKEYTAFDASSTMNSFLSTMIQAQIQADPTKIDQYKAASDYVKKGLEAKQAEPQQEQPKEQITVPASPDLPLPETTKIAEKNSSPASDTNYNGYSPKITPKSYSGSTSPRDKFLDKLDYRDLIRQEMVNNALDDSHDLNGNTLYKLNFDATVIPGNDTDSLAVIDVEIMPPNQGLSQEYIKDLYVDTLNELQVYVDNKARIMEKKKFYEWSNIDVKYAYDVIASVAWANNLYYSNNDISSWDELDLHALAIETIIYYLGVKYPIKDIFDIHSNYNKTSKHYKLVFSEKINNGKLSNEALSQFRLLIDAEMMKIRNNFYVYSSTPRESVQRISTVASRRETQELLLGLQLLAGDVGAKSAVDVIKGHEAAYEAIRRQPLAVGFSYFKESDQTHHFGWVLGPQFSVKDDGKTSHFRQTTRQTPLSAMMSLPLLWNKVGLKVKTSWVKMDGTEFESSQLDQNLTFEKSQQAYLNDQASTNIIGLIFPRFYKPTPEIDDVAGKCGEARIIAADVEDLSNILIYGDNLWRSTSVTLGSLEADQVRILPSMKAVIAGFKGKKLASLFGENESKTVLPLYVWTSKGRSTKDCDVTVIKKQSSKNGLVLMPQSNLMVGNALVKVVLKPVSGHLPEGFFDLKIQGRRYDNENWYDFKTLIDNKNNELIISTPVVDGWKDGDTIRLRLLIKNNNGDDYNYYKINDFIIYYTNSNIIKYQIVKTDETILPIVISLKFPDNIVDAIRNVSPSAVEVTGELLDNSNNYLGVNFVMPTCNIGLNNECKLIVNSSSVGGYSSDQWKLFTQKNKNLKLKLSLDGPVGKLLSFESNPITL